MLQATTRQCKDAHDLLVFKMRASPFLADKAGPRRNFPTAMEEVVVDGMAGKEQEEEAVRRWNGGPEKYE